MHTFSSVFTNQKLKKLSGADAQGWLAWGSPGRVVHISKSAFNYLMII
jgi:hypothetical protein